MRWDRRTAQGRTHGRAGMGTGPCPGALPAMMAPPTTSESIRSPQPTNPAVQNPPFPKPRPGDPHMAASTCHRLSPGQGGTAERVLPCGPRSISPRPWVSPGIRLCPLGGSWTHTGNLKGHEAFILGKEAGGGGQLSQLEAKAAAPGDPGGRRWLRWPRGSPRHLLAGLRVPAGRCRDK